MNMQIDRLKDLIEFVQESQKLNQTIVYDSRNHNELHLSESDLFDLPGISFDKENDDCSAWITIERLLPTKPKAPSSKLLELWMRNSFDPVQKPNLVEGLSTVTLKDSGYLNLKSDNDNFENDMLFSIRDMSYEEELTIQFNDYLINSWLPWSEKEVLRRKTISIYQKLFTAKKQVDGDFEIANVELIFGHGVVRWLTNKQRISYPLITIPVEINLNDGDMSLELRARSDKPLLELNIYSSFDNLGVTDLNKAAKDIIKQEDYTYNPFDQNTFEGIFRAAATFLDSQGRYYPDIQEGSGKKLPDISEVLTVTDSWCIFMRPRSVHQIIADLEEFKNKLDSKDVQIKLPRSVDSIVRDPNTLNTEIKLPNYRGISHTNNNGYSSAEAEDLYFPLAYNEEQVKIIQLLDNFDGVIVQGPPGTGKTHTIANIICHYLALGKRILVTSHKDPALAVLKEKIPEEIRPLVVSLLSSEQDGLKQFEYSIEKIGSEIQSVDKAQYEKEIKELAQTIDGLHARLSKIDREISKLAELNLNQIEIDGKYIDPVLAAKEVMAKIDDIKFLIDPINIEKEFYPQFDNEDITKLRDLRLKLVEDITYVNSKLPSPEAFPDFDTISRTHQDLAQLDHVQEQIDNGQVESLVDSRQETFKSAKSLYDTCLEFIELSQKVLKFNSQWLVQLARELENQSIDEMILQLFESLGNEIIEEDWIRKQNFINKPVSMSLDILLDDELHKAIDNQANGKSAFGVVNVLFVDKDKKKFLQEVQILGSKPNSREDWEHIKKYKDHLVKLKNLRVRWNTISQELTIPRLDKDLNSVYEASSIFDYYQELKQLLLIKAKIKKEIHGVIPAFSSIDFSLDELDNLENLAKTLQHHLTKNNLAKAWLVKEEMLNVLFGCSGDITEQIRNFIEDILGNPNQDLPSIQSKWKILHDELKRLLGLRSSFDEVLSLADKIASSGAPILAQSLQSIAAITSDDLLPTEFNKLWNIKRLNTYLESIDCRKQMLTLNQQRLETQNDLSKTYKSIILKKTWLKIAENATPDIKSALQAYLNAILSLSKTGKGKRDLRYRNDARKAASKANMAVPCWIMPHYRVSESLPPNFGCFDLVIIDEASQSELDALPALFRGEKVLIVGDDKQVSPQGIGVEEEKIKNLMNRFLSKQVESYRPQMSPERSIYDLYKVIFAESAVMLREHFRCVPPIIEYSKREFYNHELRSLRTPKVTERLDPPLIDVFVEDGVRNRTGKTNPGEIKFIIDEIQRITSSENLQNRSIGIVSLLGYEQAHTIWHEISRQLGPELIEKHNIACGDARTFQGKERDIVFLTMVVSPGESHAMNRADTEQRFNVAASRARDRMYLVRSVEFSDLSERDLLRRALIQHFRAPFANDEQKIKDSRTLCESDFEREVYDILIERGYKVTPQVGSKGYVIDLVVEDEQGTRLAIECDGDRYHGPDKWQDDMRRQKILERVGWTFWRCFASTFVLKRTEVVEDLLETINKLGIKPISNSSLENYQSSFVESRIYNAFDMPKTKDEEEVASFN